MTCPAKEKRSAYFQRGELTRRKYDGLREHHSVSTGELTAEAMQDKGVIRAGKEIRTDFARRFIVALQKMKRERRVEKVGSGRGGRWKSAAGPEVQSGPAAAPASRMMNVSPNRLTSRYD